MNDMELWLAGIQEIAMSICWVALGFFFHAYLCRTRAVNIVSDAKKKAKTILEEAKKQAENLHS